MTSKWIYQNSLVINKTISLMKDKIRKLLENFSVSIILLVLDTETISGMFGVKKTRE